MKVLDSVERVDSNCFTYSKGTFVGCFSNMPGVRFDCRLFDDAIDEGFVMVSEKTGVEMVFYRNNEVRQDGDLVSVEYVSATNPYLKTVIFND